MTRRRVCWRLRLSSPPERVFDMLDTQAGRERFWAESAPEVDGQIHFSFSNGYRTVSPILERRRPELFSLHYFAETTTTFTLAPDGYGTVLELVDDGVPEDWWDEVNPGWVSVLMAMKAAVDFGVDLRNHDAERSWDQRFVDN